MPAGHYTRINGLAMYYQLHGSGGRPLLLLHGGLTTIESSFGNLLPALTRSRQVIAVEQQGHGRTGDVDRPLSFEQMADDTATLLRQLDVRKADLLGYSDGGNVALGIAIRHPELVGRIIVAGTNYNIEGLYPDILKLLQSMTHDDMPAELREEYERVAPTPEHWPVLVAKVMKLGAEFPGWREEQIRTIEAPVLVIVGDRDIVRPEHAVEMFRLLPRAQLAVLPDTDHTTLIDRNERLLPMVETFLNDS